MISTDYAFRHVELVIAMIRGDASAMDRMDISVDGFWRSFAAILFSLPAFIFIWALGSHSPDHPSAALSPVSRFAIDAVFDVGIWIALAAAMVLVLRALSMEDRTAHFIIVRNWATCLFNYVFALALVPDLLLGPGNGLTGFVVLFVFVAMVAAFIRVTAMALQSSGLVASAFVAGEVIVVLGLAVVLYPLTG